MSRERKFDSFGEFWPFYVGAHRRTVCRALHYVGACGVFAAIATAIVTGQPWWLLAAPVAGYGFAWFAHFVFERNEPATFEYPAYSLLAEFKMFWLGVTGRMRGEVKRLYGDSAES